MNRIISLVRGAVLATGTVAIMSFAATSVMAGEGFRGFSLGVIANDSTFDSVGREEERGARTIPLPDFAPDYNTLSVSKDVSFPSLFVEYSWGDTFAMTVGLEHIPGTHEIGAKSITHSPATMAPTQDSGTRSGKAEVENVTTLYFEPGLMANDYIGIYGKFGVTGMTVNSIETTKTATYGNKTLMGGMYGVGIKLVTPYGIFFKLEGGEACYGYSLHLITMIMGAVVF